MNSLIDKIISLIKLKGDQVKLELISKFSKLLAILILFFTLAILSLLMLILLSLGIAGIFNEFLMSTYLGYFIASAFFFFMVIIIVWMARSGKLQNWVEGVIIESSYKNHE